MTNPENHHPEPAEYQPRHLHQAAEVPNNNETGSQPEPALLNDEPKAAGDGGYDHQPDPPVPEGAIAAWAALSEREYVPGCIPDDFRDCYLGTWPDRQTYIQEVLTDTLGVTLERIEDHYGLPLDCLNWNYTAIWHDLTQRFNILADDDGVHVFERWDQT